MNVNASRLEDRLGPLEPPYRSRGEAQVGRLLDRYGIPFIYERPTPVYDRRRWRTWRPDFTLPSYAGLIVEYAGMPDKPDYMAGIRHKQSAYAANALAALFIYPNDLKGPNWPEKAIKQIISSHSVARSVTRYPTKSEFLPSQSRLLGYSRRSGYTR